MSRSQKSLLREQSAFLLAEEAVELLIRTGAAPMSVYLLGTLPFLVGLMAYWAVMSASAYAYLYLSPGALALALLFLWMKTLQARFAQHLRCRLQDRPLPPWNVATFLTTFCRQGALHASAVLLYPLCFLTVLPMAYAVGWYQYVSILDDGGRKSMRALMREAGEQARLWPKQNHLLLWLASPLMVLIGGGIYLGTFPILDGLQTGGLDDSLLFTLGFVYAGILLLAMLPLAPVACLVAVNIGSALIFSLELFHILTGADTLYTRNAGALLGNSTFVAIVCGLTYVVLDPVLKAAYAIRCHEGQSLRSGIDLRVSLGRLRRAGGTTLMLVAVAAGIGFALLSPAAGAQESPTDRSTALNQALDAELAGHEYTWRMPRQPRPETELPWLLQALSDFGESVRDGIKWVFSAIGDLWDGIKRWIEGDAGRRASGGWSTDFDPSIRTLIVLLVVILLAITLYVLVRSYRMQPVTTATPLPALSDATPDLEDEATLASDLPEDEWYTLAQSLAAQGDFRLAARALFFSILATLAHRKIIQIARFKSNMDYGQEVTRKVRALGKDPTVFSQSALIYESVWYGEHEATVDTLNRMRACQEQLRHAIE